MEDDKIFRMCVCACALFFFFVLQYLYPWIMAINYVRILIYAYRKFFIYFFRDSYQFIKLFKLIQGILVIPIHIIIIWYLRSIPSTGIIPSTTRGAQNNKDLATTHDFFLHHLFFFFFFFCLEFC